MTEPMGDAELCRKVSRFLWEAANDFRATGLADRGDDLSLKHEARMLALTFSDAPKVPQPGVFQTGDGTARNLSNALYEAAARIEALAAERDAAVAKLAALYAADGFTHLVAEGHRRATAEIVAFVAKQGWMQWLVDQIEAGDHLPPPPVTSAHK